MKFSEVHGLLMLIGTYSGREMFTQPDDATVTAWREILDDLPYQDCKTAIINHFATSDAYLMPVHVRKGAIEIDKNRRRKIRELKERQELQERETHAIEAAKTRSENCDQPTQFREMMAELKAKLGPPKPEKLRRPEVVKWDQERARKERWKDEKPNPHYDPDAMKKLAEMDEQNLQNRSAA